MSTTQEFRVFEFDRFRLDLRERLLTADGKPVSLTPKVFDLLTLFVQRPGQLLEKEWMLATLWPGTFVEEANLSVNISTLRKALEAAGGAHYIETVPKRGYRFAGSVLESTPAAPKPQPMAASADTTEVPLSVTGNRWRKWVSPGVVILLTTAVIVLVIERIASRSVSSPAQIRSLAVLPFQPLSENGAFREQDEYLASGMADAVIRSLSSLKKIKVRATSSVQRYQGAHVDPLKAGRELEVDEVLEGRVQHSGQTIRVSFQLLNVADGTAIWADHFDDYYSNIFQVQDSISEKVAYALKMKLTEADRRKMAKRSTSNFEAYQLYMNAKYCEMRRATDAPKQDCVALYEQVVAKDPDFALAYAGIARTYMEIASMEERPDATPQARLAADRAISLDDELPEAHLALGNVLLRGDWDWLGARREFDRALALDENSSLGHWYMALLLIAMAQTEHGLSEMRMAQTLDPASQNLRDDLGWAYYCDRRYDEAIRESKLAVVMDSQSYAAHHQLGKAYLQAGQFDLAATEFAATMRLSQVQRGLADLGQLYALTGKRAEAIRVMSELQQSNAQSRTYEYEYMAAVLEGSLANKDAALVHLQKAVAAKLSRAIWMRVDPDLDPLRSDDRFAALLRKVHLMD